MQYELSDQFTSSSGFIQGDVLTSILDDLLSLSLLAFLAQDLFAPTLGLMVDFISQPVLENFGYWENHFPWQTGVCIRSQFLDGL
jgi:hypothetical protein